MVQNFSFVLGPYKLRNGPVPDEPSLGGCGRQLNKTQGTVATVVKSSQNTGRREESHSHLLSAAVNELALCITNPPGLFGWL